LARNKLCHAAHIILSVSLPSEEENRWDKSNEIIFLDLSLPTYKRLLVLGGLEDELCTGHFRAGPVIRGSLVRHGVHLTAP
jgi:hypothetical protein